MKQLRFVLHNLLFYIATIIGLFIVEASTASFNKPSYGLANPFFFVFSILSIGLMIFYYVVDGKKNGFKPSAILISFISILYVSLIFATIYVKDQSFTDSLGNVHEAIFTPLDKFKYCIEITILFLILYGLFALYINKKFSTKSIHWIFILYVIFIIISIISSFFINFNIYKDIFKGLEPSSGIKSFYINENIYGMAILIGILSLFILNVYKRSWYKYLLIIVFYLANIFSTCVTTIILSSLAILVYFVYEIIYSLKKKLVVGLIFLSISLIFVFSFIVTYELLLINNVKWMVNLNKYLFENIALKDYKTLSSRTVIWKRIFDEILINPIYLIFGTGFKTSTVLLKNMMSEGTHLTSINSAHNGYIEIMLSSGIIGIAIYALFLILIGFISIKLMIKKKFRFAFIYDICIGVLLGHGIAESTILFGLDTQNIIIGFLFVAPLLIEYRNVYKNELVTDFVSNENIKPVKIKKIRLKGLLTSILLGLTLSSASLLLLDLTYDSIKLRNSVILITILLLIYSLFLPQLLVNLSTKASRKKFTLRIITSLSIILIPTFVLSFVLLNKDDISIHALYIVPLFNLVILLLINIIYTKRFSSFKAWGLSIIKGLKYSLFGILFSLITIAIFFLILPNFIGLTLFTSIIFALITFAIYFLIILFSNFKTSKYLIKTINDKLLYDYKQALIRDYK